MQTLEAIDLTDRLREQEEHLPACTTCGQLRLYVLEERPDPNFGVLGVVQRTLRCADCDRLSVT
jgi:hypothetical protein